MTVSPKPPEALIAFCKACSAGLTGLTDNEACIRSVSGMLPRLIADKALFRNILEGMVADAPYPDLRYATMFDSEVILYRDPKQLFSLRLFFWEPGVYDPVHDHNAWGVVGPVAGDLEIVNYRRFDDGLREGHACLEETGRRTIRPGESYHVCGPQTIHKTGNPGSRMTLQVSIYGRPWSRRDHVNGFDVAGQRIYPIYAPKTIKQRLAAQSLSVL
jgi:predicted metal-dependent enzyme (double-stranded beta helix superfamily)